MPIKKTTIGSGITQEEQYSFSSPLTRAEVDFLIDRVNALPTVGPLQQIVGFIENHVQAQFAESGLAGDLPIARFHESPLFEAVRGQDLETKEWYAVKLLQLLRVMQLEFQQGNIEHAISDAFELGTLYAEAKIKFEWEDDALDGRKTKKTRETNLDQGRKKQSQAASVFWAPKKDRFAKLKKEHKTQTRALKALMDEMSVADEHVPSEKTFKIRLALIVDWPRFKNRVEGLVEGGLDLPHAVRQARKEFEVEGLKVPSIEEALARPNLSKKS